jgi:SlyX protein
VDVMENRLEKIESKLGLAEDLLDELNKTIYRQQQQIERMQHEMRTLRQQVQAAQPAEQRNLLDEIPPHY